MCDRTEHGLAGGRQVSVPLLVVVSFSFLYCTTNFPSHATDGDIQTHAD